jgi:hypothetical protein
MVIDPRYPVLVDLAAFHEAHHDPQDPLLRQAGYRARWLVKVARNLAAKTERMTQMPR